MSNSLVNTAFLNGWRPSLLRGGKRLGTSLSVAVFFRLAWVLSVQGWKRMATSLADMTFSSWPLLLFALWLKKCWAPILLVELFQRKPEAGKSVLENMSPSLVFL